MMKLGHVFTTEHYAITNALCSNMKKTYNDDKKGFLAKVGKVVKEGLSLIALIIAAPLETIPGIPLKFAVKALQYTGNAINNLFHGQGKTPETTEESETPEEDRTEVQA